ncbi:MAG: winged helix-turn-helix domain-containing protein [Acidobacteriia bacterium]|nr:winged helix-turn-helix domain-containing protein [Terriglobia bacterium]
MTPATTIRFPPFQIDLAAGRLCRGSNAIGLPPKAFGVLQYLAERPGRLVSKEELLGAMWPNVHVGDAVLKVTIAEIRRALADSSQEPKFIETAHRRGYRFIAQTESACRETHSKDSDMLATVLAARFTRLEDVPQPDPETALQLEHQLNQRIAGFAVELARAIAEHAGAGEILVPATVRDLVTAPDIQLRERGVLFLRGGGTLAILSVNSKACLTPLTRTSACVPAFLVV